MKTNPVSLVAIFLATIFATLCPAQQPSAPAKLKVHGIFASNMVLQRGKPIVVWGWAAPGKSITVQLGQEKAEAKSAGDKGRWEVTFPAREANAEPQTMVVTNGDEKIEMQNIVVGDVWVMTCQSNMAFGLGKVLEGDMESVQAHLPMLRFFSIDPNEQSEPQDDIPAVKISTQGWAVSSPETALEFSAIGYVFGARLQKALQVPIGVIKSARGGASIEAIVPSHKFDSHPDTKRGIEVLERLKTLGQVKE